MKYLYQTPDFPLATFANLWPLEILVHALTRLFQQMWELADKKVKSGIQQDAESIACSFPLFDLWLSKSKKRKKPAHFQVRVVLGVCLQTKNWSIETFQTCQSIMFICT